MDALERGVGEDLPIADENLTWDQLFGRIAEAVGRPRRVRRIPPAVIRSSLRAGSRLQSLAGRESGVDPAEFADLLLRELFIDPPTGRPLDAAFAASFSTGGE
ncbi:hypothetical protein [Paractinoplanes globisporus]|uniref:Uncharacterized protein n=1 Tax=Paractinoplanes globisporus TaxID=113565 RepID=A0ABW6WUN2_9ACTN